MNTNRYIKTSPIHHMVSVRVERKYVKRAKKMGITVSKVMRDAFLKFLDKIEAANARRIVKKRA